MALNDDLFDATVRHAVFLERLKTAQEFEALGVFNSQLTPKLIARITNNLKQPMTRAELAKLNRQLKTIIDSGLLRIEEGFEKELLAITKNEAVFQKNLIQRQFPIGVVLAEPSTAITAQILAGRPIRGKLFKQMFKELTADVISKVNTEINIGLVQGEPIPSIIRRVKGTRANKFADGILNRSRNDISTIVRTSVNHVTTQAKEEVYKANTDVIKAVQWRSTLDSRTSQICASLDGQVFDVGRGPRPPAHFNCRSTTVPITKSFKELGIGLKEVPGGQRVSAGFIERKAKTLPRSEVTQLRRELNGLVPAKTTYGQFLKRQPIAFQEEVLGKGKAELFRRGVVPIESFANNRLRPLSLTELVALEEKLK